MLCDTRGVTGTSREARTYSSSDAFRYVTAVALLVSSPLSKIIGNFFTKLNNPGYAVRLFTDETAALDWLKTFQTDDH